MASRFLAPGARGTALQRGAALNPLLMLQRDMDRLFGNIVRSIGADDEGGELLLAPRIDVRETESGMEVDAELPGVDERDVEVAVDGDLLVIAGETRREKQEEKGGYRLAERQIGRFRRAIQLPFAPEADKVEAEFRNGLLSVRIPQPPKVDNTRRIAVKTGGDTKPESEKAASANKPAREHAEA